jgi:uncharacterized membrane protein HdeD (DUF308 family)
MKRDNAPVVLGAGIGVILAGMVTTTLGYFGDASLIQFVGALMIVAGILLTVIGNHLRPTRP